MPIKFGFLPYSHTLHGYFRGLWDSFIFPLPLPLLSHTRLVSVALTMPMSLVVSVILLPRELSKALTLRVPKYC